jgi:ABC-type transporter Mla subunit MlaD
MIISVKKDDGDISYDVNNISDQAKQGEARVIITKVGTLETMLEAINFASATHRANLEKLLEGCEEALIESAPTEEVSETKIITEDTKDK